MTVIDYRAQAAQARKDADKYRRWSVADARFAARQYEAVRSLKAHARFLTHFPPLWSPHNTPGEIEEMARVALRVADLYLYGTFMNAESSRACRELARSWAALAEQQERQLATLAGQQV